VRSAVSWRAEQPRQATLSAPTCARDDQQRSTQPMCADDTKVFL
jgi:hypothetical protein